MKPITTPYTPKDYAGYREYLADMGNELDQLVEHASDLDDHELVVLARKAERALNTRKDGPTDSVRFRR